MQFYDSEEFLVETVCAFLATALHEGDAAIVAATGAHRHAFERLLAQAGIDIDAATREGRYLAFDASDLLSRFMLDGRPDPARFADALGAVMDFAACGGREIRVYGEMVALLCERGDSVSAMALEDLWNDLADSREFQLLCAYPMRLFGSGPAAAAFEHICDQHSQVIPCEGYPQLAAPVEQSRAVASLQRELAVLARGNARSSTDSSILDAAGEGIFGCDANGTFTFANPAAMQMTGYAPEEMAGRQLRGMLDRSPAGVRLDRSRDGPLADGRTHHCEHATFWRKNGTTFPVECTSTPILVGDVVTGAVVVFHDISERLASQRARDELSSVVSHELRTPLTSIRASLGLLESGVLGPLSDEGRRMLQIAVQNTDRLVRLINDTLDLARVDAGAPLRRTPCEAAGLVDRAVEAVLPMAVEAGVRLETDARPAIFAADSDGLIQTLTNLIANAVKFSPRGGAVRITAGPRDGGMLFEVADEGRGIPSDKLESIFERFEQVDRGDGEQMGGTGLGLAICRSIVERHDGRIWARSERGAGSTFSFVIPGPDPDLAVLPVRSGARLAA